MSEEKSKRCCICKQAAPRSAFSATQWKKGGGAKCVACTVRVAEAGERGAIAASEHEMSLGLVDGKRHRAPGRSVVDPTRRAAACDFKVAEQVMAEFDTKFKLKTQTVDEIAALHTDDESYKAFRKMRSLPALDSLCDEISTDFITTVREPPVRHLPFGAMPSRQVSDVRPMGTFSDAPFMTAVTDLKFCCTEPEQQYVSSMRRESVVRHSGGTTLMTESGVLVAARCSSTLDPKISTELLNVYWEMEKLRDFLQRGKAVANVCCNFAVTGTKSHMNTKLLMSHQTGSLRELRMRAKFVGLFKRHVWPLVQKEFRWLFDPVLAFVKGHDIPVWAEGVTGVTGGRLFWPRSHVDPDFWYTVLVALDYGRGVHSGGDFAFGGVGWVLECRHGDILVYNGLHLHGTTEFRPHGPGDGRIFFAFYAKRQVLEAGIRSRSLVSRVGSSALSL